MPRWVVAQDDAGEDGETSDSGAEDSGEHNGAVAATSASDAGEDPESEQSEEEEEQAADQPSTSQGRKRTAAPGQNQTAPKRGKISVKKLGARGGKDGLVCHVCGHAGHCAGFVGAVYQDCPNKPCYLCKATGHTTLACPYRVRQDHDFEASSSGRDSALAAMQEREQGARAQAIPIHRSLRWQVDAAVLRLLSRRCTCVEFHPVRDNIVVAGDKKGHVAVWNWQQVYERTVYGDMHQALTNTLRFLRGGDGMRCCSASSDGLLKIFDIETGADSTLLNLNPDGWISGVSNANNWKMLYGMAAQGDLICAGDSQGTMWLVDHRSKQLVSERLVHKKGNKVNSVDANPADPNLLVTASNDWTVRLHDLRMLGSARAEAKGKGKAGALDPMLLSVLEHPRLVNSAYFSPNTGRKLMTTCIDNRIRVWDSLHHLHREPDRDIIHSHDFSRYLTPFRCQWDPKDLHERRMIIGRYISEDFSDLALHPVDILDAGNGRQLAQLTDPNLTTICTVNVCHPRLDVIVSGSSRSLYAWMPKLEGEEAAAARASETVAAVAAEGALQGSASYVFWDAGEGDAAKKKKKKAAAGKGPAGGKGAKPKTPQSDDDSD